MNIERLLVKIDRLLLRYFFFLCQRSWFNVYNFFNRRMCRYALLCLCVRVFVIHLPLCLLSALVVKNIIILLETQARGLFGNKIANVKIIKNLKPIKMSSYRKMYNFFVLQSQ